MSGDQDSDDKKDDNKSTFEDFTEPMDFDLTRLEAKVTIRIPATDEHGPRMLKCVLQELIGPERDQYLNFMGGKMKFNEEGNSEGLTDFNRLQSKLISMALFIDDEDRAPIGEGEIQRWPARVQKSLYDRIRKMSGLDEKAEKRAKNG